MFPILAPLMEITTAGARINPYGIFPIVSAIYREGIIMRKIISNATFCAKDGEILVNPLRYMDNARTLSADHGISFKDEIISLIRSGKEKDEIYGYIELALRATRQERAAAMGEKAFGKWIKSMISRHYVEARKKMDRQDGIAPSTNVSARRNSVIRRSSNKYASFEEIAQAIATYLSDIPKETLETITIMDIGVSGKEIREEDFRAVLNVLYMARKLT